MKWQVINIKEFQGRERCPHITLYTNRVQFNRLTFKNLNVIGKKFELQVKDGVYRFFINTQQGIELHDNKCGYCLYSIELYNYLSEHFKKNLIYIKIDGNYIYLDLRFDTFL